MQTNSENTISKINSNVFFKEFTFTKNNFTDLTTKQRLEFSDNVVWLDNIFFIIEIKERDSNEGMGEEKWFDNKVLRKAVNQIKNSHRYLEKYPEIPIVNEKGHSKNISNADLNDIQNIVIYSVSTEFSEEKRHIKFYQSQAIGLIHLFHSEDYYWICKYLITPAEVKEYLVFREKLFLNHPNSLNHLPEQYVLGHFLETLDTSELVPRYIENLSKYRSDLYDFNMSYIINNFKTKISQDPKGKTDYYFIIAELAKLNRSELSEFKKRYLRAVEKCQESEIDTPYRMYIPRTDCAFVFIPLVEKVIEHWETALTNYSFAQKYDQKATKCVGLVIYEIVLGEEKYFDMRWMYLEEEWKYNEEMEELLSRNFPFRGVKTKYVDNRYIPDINKSNQTKQ